MKRSRLSRRTPLRSTGGLSRTSGLKPVSRKQVRRNARWAKVRVQALVRDRGLCQRCGAEATDVHHRQGRVGDRMFRLDLLVSVCRACHDWIELNRQLAYAQGWLVRRNGKETS